MAVLGDRHRVGVDLPVAFFSEMDEVVILAEDLSRECCADPNVFTSEQIA